MMTHKHLFIDVTDSTETESNTAAAVEEEEEEDDDEDKLGLWASVIGLVVITGIVAVFSEFLVASIDDVCITYNISKVGGWVGG